MTYVWGIIIGIVVGAIGWYLIRDRQANAIWLAPVVGIVGGIVGAIIDSVFGTHPGFGWKKALLEIVLAVIAVGLLVFQAKRNAGQTTAPSGPQA